MSDPISKAKQAATIARAAGGVLDLVGDGLATDLRERFGPILPNVDGMVAAMAQQNREETLAIMCDVVRAILAGHLGVEPNSQQVWQFIDKASNEPAFRARSMRLLAEACRAPASLRRRMLALALFRPLPDPDARDRVDSAVERLDLADLELLRQLIELDVHAHGFYVGNRKSERADSLTATKTVALSARTGKALPTFEPVLECSVASIVRLRSADCVDFVSGDTISFSEGWLAIRTLEILALGQEVIDTLKDEWRRADIEESGAAR